MKKVKGTLVTILSVVFVLASIAMMNVSAKSNMYNYTEKVTKNNVVHHPIPSSNGNTHIDVFGNYMAITGANTSTVKAWVTDTNFKYTSKSFTKTFQKDSAEIYSCNYGAWKHAGKTYHNFIVTKGGKINLHVTTQVKYS